MFCRCLSRMKNIFVAVLVSAGLLACEDRTAREPGEEPAAGEEKRMETFETAGLRDAIDDYKQDPTEANRKKVEESFEELDKEIQDLEARVASTGGDEKAEAQRKLDDLRSFKYQEQVRFTGQQAESAAEKVGETIEKAAEQTGEFLKKAGEDIKERVSGDEGR
jgi:hypothetical protein